MRYLQKGRGSPSRKSGSVKPEMVCMYRDHLVEYKAKLHKKFTDIPEKMSFSYSLKKKDGSTATYLYFMENQAASLKI